MDTQLTFINFIENLVVQILYPQFPYYRSFSTSSTRGFGREVQRGVVYHVWSGV